MPLTICLHLLTSSMGYHKGQFGDRIGNTIRGHDVEQHVTKLVQMCFYQLGNIVRIQYFTCFYLIMTGLLHQSFYFPC